MYAIIETGGKQYKVTEGDVITVEKLAVEQGQQYDFDKVIMVAKENDVTVKDIDSLLQNYKFNLYHYNQYDKYSIIS